MSSILCNLHFTNQSDNKIFMSRELMRNLKLTANSRRMFNLGKKTMRASIRSVNKFGKHVYLPSSFQSSMKVPAQERVLILRKTDGNVQIGPLIGILTSAQRGNMTLPFGIRTGFIRQFLEMGTNKAFYFAFTPEEINWDQETVVGYFINPNGIWTRKVVPFPEVIYNRLPNRISDTSIAIQNIKYRFTNMNIPIFNWSFFTKQQVYNLLEQDTDAARYVPESYINPSADKINELLERHQFVYLKPTGGSLGIGIYRITFHPKRGYYARFRRGNNNVLLHFRSFDNLINMLNIRGGRLRNYVIQQGIRLIEIDNCPIDFRFHVNKNGQNQWVVSGIGAKKAGRGSVTTHIKNGGMLMTPEEALHRAFGDRADLVLQNARQVAIKLSEAIERNYPHRLGELGFDLGVDRNENIWMFEANSKPGRTIFKHPALKEQGKDTLTYIYEHCLYLSKFKGWREA